MDGQFPWPSHKVIIGDKINLSSTIHAHPKEQGSKLCLEKEAIEKLGRKIFCLLSSSSKITKYIYSLYKIHTNT